jgi:hypothetical protein
VVGQEGDAVSQLDLFSRPAKRRQEQGPYPNGWHPDELPEPAATAARQEPALAAIAARTTVHRLHDETGIAVTRGRNAGLAYLEQRAGEMILAKMASTTGATDGQRDK